MWKIDKDWIAEEGEETRVGFSGETYNIGHPIMPEWIDLPITEKKTRFRMKDDDGIVYYSGWLHNDDECLNQMAALEFGMHDAGCTTIEVKVSTQGQGVKWKQEIG